MSKISSLQELYVDELKDLWSANDQMVRALTKIGPQAQNPKLQSMLKKSQTGITKHTGIFKSIIEAQGETVKKEHCKGWQPKPSSTRLKTHPKQARCLTLPSLRKTSA